MAYRHIESLDFFLKNTSVFAVPNDILQSLRMESRIARPSTGLRCLYWLKKIVKIDGNLDVYGFTFNRLAPCQSGQDDEDIESRHHYFDGDEAGRVGHNFKRESLFLAKLLHNEMYEA